jgi:hypothetical protein
MILSFISVVDSINEEGWVCFAEKPGAYRIVNGPEDVEKTIRQALHHGNAIEVFYKADTMTIDDALPWRG